MAAIESESGTIRVILRPHKVAEAGNPSWITSLFEVVVDDVEEAFSAVLSVTDSDLDELIRAFHVAGEKGDGFELESMDGDLVVGAGEGPRPSDMWVWFWHGDAASCMKGWRFLASRSGLLDFGESLRREAELLA
jgi:hypothetical protein